MFIQMFQLSQRDTRTLMDEPKENLVIGFHVLRCEANRKFRSGVNLENTLERNLDFPESKT